MEQIIAGIAVENVSYHFDILYGYIIPPEMQGKARIGSRVLVGFSKGNSKRQGIVFSLEQPEEGKKYKKIIEVLDDEPLMTAEMIELSKFLKERTFCTYFEAAKAQLPTGFNYKLNVTYVAVESNGKAVHLSDDEQKVYNYMLEKVCYQSKKKILSDCSLPVSSPILEKLVTKGLAEKNTDTAMQVGELSVKTAILMQKAEEPGALSQLTKKQESVLSVLRDVGSAQVKELCAVTGVSAAVVKALEKKELISIIDSNVYRIPKTEYVNTKASGDISLTDMQNKAYSGLCEKYKNGGGVSLLFGVTGSGKTSVFLKLIDDVVADRKNVIVMVPEISLTPQMMSLFKGRYGEKVAIFHSALSMGERKDEYRRVKRGLAQIVVGTRSAVFAPFENIGLIVIDEEQEHTYKSESSPRYHARDVAKFRAKKEFTHLKHFQNVMVRLFSLTCLLLT